MCRLLNANVLQSWTGMLLSSSVTESKVSPHLHTNAHLSVGCIAWFASRGIRNSKM